MDRRPNCRNKAVNYFGEVWLGRKARHNFTADYR